MARSKCQSCGGFSFELVFAEIQNSRFQLHFVQCSSCGGVIGVQEHDNVTETLRKQGKLLDRIARSLTR